MAYRLRGAEANAVDGDDVGAGEDAMSKEDHKKAVHEIDIWEAQLRILQRKYEAEGLNSEEAEDEAFKDIQSIRDVR